MVQEKKEMLEVIAWNGEGKLRYLLSDPRWI